MRDFAEYLKTFQIDTILKYTKGYSRQELESKDLIELNKIFINCELLDKLDKDIADLEEERIKEEDSWEIDEVDEFDKYVEMYMDTCGYDLPTAVGKAKKRVDELYNNL